ncbi:hypothetical protein F7D01_01985 [Erythrobacter sp. 3-20A1M]|uniref:hypothetical protein n=1 Tax=Erythrobacter sp. 3-20A1M TaxID=2653850 RepID=UPI001BFC0711|nr:hypothetical protein [Erythrobacter sp. 3-20A1M]QWC56031.1 hypothetical protein F7D01_01985 [Erythrobacter sp. 3-20A1M]
MHEERPLPRRPRARRTPADRLRAALLALADGHGIVRAHRETPWASITFAGARHRVVLCFEGAEAIAAGEQFSADLPEHEFTIPGQLVADATVVEVDHVLLPQPRLTVTAELLLLEDV